MRANVLSNLSRARPFFDLPSIGQLPFNSLMTPPGFVFDGAIPDLFSLVQMLQAVLAQQQSGNPLGQNFQTSAAATITLTNLYQAYVKLTNGGAVTVTLDYAYNIVNQIPFPYLGQAFSFQIVDNAATTVATPTLSDTAVTLAGTTTVTSGGFRHYQGVITQLATTSPLVVTTGTTFTSIAQVGTTNAYTVTLVTNAVVPVVGQVFFLNVTTGTLPPGWYPVVKVTSATSFIVALPPTSVAWTATAATVPVLTSVPTSAYTPGLTLLPGQTTAITGQQGVYSPTITITGMMGMAAGVMVV